ncbi:MAG: hypothetical protein IJS58_00565 [Bacilli bacterium]|nr:hypothetical protein [Bacilli bacterium]
MRLKQVEATEMILTMGEIRDQIKSKFKKGDILHVVKGKKKVFRKEISFVEAYDSFLEAESVINKFYTEPITITYADLLVNNVIIEEIITKKPIIKKKPEAEQ